ncbi:MAG: hypothetical protein AAFU56_00445, partial [Pseudomonadota bacterium]
MPAQGRRAEKSDLPAVAVYATQSDDRVTVFALSRRVPNYPNDGNSGDTRVSIELPFSSAKSALRYSMTGGLLASNRDGPNAGIVSRPVALPKPGMPLVIDRLPAGETMVYVFEGVE